MNWFTNLFFGTGIAHSIVVLALAITVGITLGAKLKFKGITLGITWILFCAIACSHFGMTLDPMVESFAKDFGLILFVYSIGLQVGPSFFSSFGKGGLSLNMLAASIVLLGCVTAYVIHLVSGVDIATMTGAQVVSSDVGIELKEVGVEVLGTARQVKITKENTVIVDGAGKSEEIKGRIKQIEAQIEITTSDYDREKLQERLAKMSGGVAVIKVGAATEAEMKEKKLRVEDALNATRAAVEEGIVAGGGSIYVNAAKAVEKMLGTLSGDEKTGAAIIAKALTAPIRQIAINAGLEGSVILEKVKNNRNVNYGFDAANEVYGDMLTAGIVDPAKVCRSALENAASVSAMLLTTEALVADKPEPPAPAAPAAGGDMGMY